MQAPNRPLRHCRKDDFVWPDWRAEGWRVWHSPLPHSVLHIAGAIAPQRLGIASVSLSEHLGLSGMCMLGKEQSQSQVGLAYACCRSEVETSSLREVMEELGCKTTWLQMLCACIRWYQIPCLKAARASTETLGVCSRARRKCCLTRQTIGLIAPTPWVAVRCFVCSVGAQPAYRHSPLACGGATQVPDADWSSQS